MNTITVNGVEYRADGAKKLIDFLREDLRLTSVKNGCGSGACGACTILVDGKTVRSCVLPVAKFEGKRILTVEGLSAREKSVYAHCFASAGAVQCGFCIPGMVLSAKSLLDVNNSPSRSEVKTAIKNNICRCTGYVKIEDAILNAARHLRENISVPHTEFNLPSNSKIVLPKPASEKPVTGKLGEDLMRLDATEKTLGTGLYADDLTLPGMLYAAAFRSPFARALIRSIKTDKALMHPDCKAVFTAKDIPGNIKLGHLKKDWDAFIDEGACTRCIGDALALVVCTKPESLTEVLKLIEVDAKELVPLENPTQALSVDAPILHPEINAENNILSHEHLIRGNAAKALSESAYVETMRYSLPFTEHAFMEPECAVALWQDDTNSLLLYTGSQSVYDEQREIASMLGIEKEKTRCRSMLVGGGFGGKEDMSVQHFAALAAFKLKQPVKMRFSRQESINVHPKRHAMEIELTAGCTKDGELTAVKAVIISDTGAYASLGGPVLQRACTHAAGPYRCANIDIEGTSVYTNNPPAGAFRGFGVTQTTFAMECTLNLLAQKVGLSPWQIRHKNALRVGDVLPNGQIADSSTAIIECLDAVKDIYENAKCAGIAASLKNSGLGVGIPDFGRCIISVEQGRAHIRTSAACIGQGLATVALQMFCQTTGLPADSAVVEPPDTARTPNSGTTTASRQTVFTGEAVVVASRKLNAALKSGKTLKSLEGDEFYGEYTCPTDPLGSSKQNPVSHAAYGYAVQVVELDEAGKVSRVTAAYDAGQVVNPKSCEGQIEGGVVMGLGYALTEDFPLVKGVPSVKYGTLGLWRANETPPVDIILVRSKADCDISLQPDGKTPPAFGAKGVGELAVIPTAPAVQNAYYKFDGVFRTKLPLEGTAYHSSK